MALSNYQLPGKGETYFKLFVAFACVALTISCICTVFTGLILADPEDSIAMAIFTSFVHGTCAICSGILFFLPENHIATIILITLQVIHEIIVGYEHVGIIIGVIGIQLLFAWGYFRTHTVAKFATIYTVWIAAFTWILIRYTIDRYIFDLGVLFFATAAYLYVYYLLSDKLSYLLPAVEETDGGALISLPEKGSHIYLSEMELTEQQIEYIRYIMQTKKTYNEISAETGRNLSAVKREMSVLFKLFGVKNRDSLHLLLLQYDIHYPTAEKDKLDGFIDLRKN